MPMQKQKEAKKKRQKKSAQELQKKANIGLEELRDIVKNRDATLKEIQEALESVIKYHGVIHQKLGVRVHPDSDIYMDILFRAARHPKIEKNTLLHFNKSLEKLNPQYKKEINDALMRGLNSRGL